MNQPQKLDQQLEETTAVSVSQNTDALPLLQKIAANIPGMIFQFLQHQDGQQRVLYASSGCRDLYELEPEAVQADFQLLFRLTHPEDIRNFKASVAVSASTGQPWSWEGRIITPSGKLKWIECASRPERQPNGDILWHGLLMDVTDRKLAEEKLRESEARYKAILDAIPDFIFRINRDGEYLDFKGEGANATLSRSEIIGKCLSDLLPPSVTALSMAAIAQTLQSRCLQTCEYQLPTPVGMRDYEARLVVSGEDEVLAIVRDITERKHTEVQLRLTAQRDRVLTQSLARIRRSLNLDQILHTTVHELRQFLQADRVCIGMITENGQGQVVAESVDPNYPSLLGWVVNDDDPYLHHLREYFAINRARVVEDAREILLESPCREFYENYQIKAILGVPITVGEEFFGLLVAHQCSSVRPWQTMEVEFLEQMSSQVAIAIQQAQLYKELADLNSSLEHQVQERTAQLQQKMQELQELNRVKDVFLHTVSHDLRTSVMGSVMVLQNLLTTGTKDWGRSPTSPTTSPSLIPVPRSILERMMQGNDRQLALIDSLLEIHASTQQGIILHREPVPFHSLLGSILQDSQPLIANHQAQITNLVTANLPLVMADPTQIQRVLTHLLTYTLQNNPPGLNLTITARVEAQMMRCLITDDGVGMSNLECDRCFDLYVRDPQARFSTPIGLKLHLCRQIIKAHGGEIGVSNNPTQGSTFWFTLPL